jgi:hypothetical protein
MPFTPSDITLAVGGGTAPAVGTADQPDPRAVVAKVVPVRLGLVAVGGRPRAVQAVITAGGVREVAAADRALRVNGELRGSPKYRADKAGQLPNASVRSLTYPAGFLA